MSVNPLELFRKNRADLSNFVIHLTKNGSFETWRKAESLAYKGRFLFGPSETINAEDSLLRILKGSPPTLLARSPFGVFKVIGINVGKIKKMDIHPDTLKAVCFSETPLRELSSFYQSTQDEKNWKFKTNKYQKFGLAFSTEFMRGRGGHPVFYYDRKNEPIRLAVESLGNESLLPVTEKILALFEPYGPKILDPTKEIDFRWEREWRIKGDFKFSWSDVAFGICPTEKIKDFENLVERKFPFIDPDGGIDDLKQGLEKRGWKSLAEKM